MSTNCQPSSHGSVHRKMEAAWKYLVQRASYPTTSSWEEWIMEISCVTTADQEKAEIFILFLFDAAIMNAYVLWSPLANLAPFKNFKSFRLQLAKELIGEYCSHRLWGRGGTVFHPLLFCHFPIRWQQQRHPRGPCTLLHDTHHRRVLSTYLVLLWVCIVVVPYWWPIKWLSCSGTHDYMFDFMRTS